MIAIGFWNYLCNFAQPIYQGRMTKTHASFVGHIHDEMLNKVTNVSSIIILECNIQYGPLFGDL